ncbi:MAG: class I SAM-dependent methyltransferase [Desulfobacteraceae bacterium]|jgi:SAM-dependent methyltransferase|nr:class I SAM-dependent methyltransferase [Desulfobacteraceae bacterium]
MHCRFCNTQLKHVFIDLVNAPPSNSFLTEAQLNEPEVYYPLKLYVCHNCYLVQIDEYRKSDDIFNSDYAYFSSYSTTWVEHARQYVEMIVPKLGLGKNSMAIEIASNDGYLLQHFKSKQIPSLGIEPTENTAAVAREKGIETITEFFGEKLAKKLVAHGKTADLIIGNNVFAHVPDINDFVCGLKTVLAHDGSITLEFPYLLKLMLENQFDTIYHEHFSYFSFHTVQQIFKKHGLTLYDVEEIPTHGGSLRIYARHTDDKTKPVAQSIDQLLKKEVDAGMMEMGFYAGFQQRADRVKYHVMSFLMEQKKKGKTVVAYGAAAKGNTMLNYCGIKKDLVQFVVDASPHKQSKYLPGSHIPVVKENRLHELKPDFVFILPWNIKEEIMDQLAYVRKWNSRFIVAVPTLDVLE